MNFRITNIPILLNTSFNENEPIVMKPENAIDCFENENGYFSFRKFFNN